MRIALTASALVAFAALAACNGGSGFGSNFEGEVTMKTTHPSGQPTSMTIKAKGDKLRLEIPGPDGKTASAIYVPQDNKLVVLLDAQKTAMDMNFASPSAPQPNTNAQTSVIDKTGKKETIAGVACEDWVVKDPSGSRTETCVAEGLPYLDLDGLRHGGAGSSSWKAEMRAKRTFPLRSVEYDKSSKELTRAEVTEVKREKLDDSEFVVPADYSHIPMGQPIGQPAPH